MVFHWPLSQAWELPQLKQAGWVLGLGVQGMALLQQHLLQTGVVPHTWGVSLPCPLPTFPQSSARAEERPGHRSSAASVPLVWANGCSLQAWASQKINECTFGMVQWAEVKPPPQVSSGSEARAGGGGGWRRWWWWEPPPQTFPSRLPSSLLKPKARGLDLTSPQEEVIQQLSGHQTPSRTCASSGQHPQRPGPSPAPTPCCPKPWGSASFSPLESPGDTWVLRRLPLPQALNAGPSKWSLSSYGTAVIAPHCFPVAAPAPLRGPPGLGLSLLGKGVVLE